jgi:uncharacterized membrane protein YccC
VVAGPLTSRHAWLASLVTIPVAFCIFFAGATGPNAASGVTAALLAYVLPVASTGNAGMIPARLAGWWLASAVSTAAVLITSPRPAGHRLRSAAAATATALAGYLAAAAAGDPAPGGREALLAAKHELMNVFSAAPYSPTGLAAADQALAEVVQLLEWCTTLAGDALGGHPEPRCADPGDRELLGTAAGVLRGVAVLLGGGDARPDLARLDAARAASAAHQRDHTGDPARLRACAAYAVHAQAIAIASLAAAAEAMIATERGDPETIAAGRRLWYRQGETWSGAWPPRRALAGAARFTVPRASLRSVWFLNSARGAVALAAAVAVADLTGVQHGFWVVLGTLSVLRTSAASTGATALRALAGTAAGFLAGAALLLALPTGPVALWAALPAAVLVAAYAPGAAPFAVGQAAFTVTVVVLFNLLVPAGWSVGLLRVQDVALGCGVSLAVGVLFWPRGASAVVGDDLADAFRSGAAYLIQAVDWVLGLRAVPPDTGAAAATAGIRLDDALRGFLAEQGSKRISKHDLWVLVMATMRIRLTAHSLEGLNGPGGHAAAAAAARGGPERAGLHRLALDLARFYERAAVAVAKPGASPPPALAVPAFRLDGAAGTARGDGTAAPDPAVLWAREHLRDLTAHGPAVAAPAAALASIRRRPWWR